MGVDVYESGSQEQPVDVEDLTRPTGIDRCLDRRDPSLCNRHVAVAGDTVPGIDNVSVTENDVVCLGASASAACKEQRHGDSDETTAAKHAKINNSKL